MLTNNFDYHLPKDLIAQTPISPRDHSRMLGVSRDGGGLRHRRFYDLPDFLRDDDVLVFNDSRVFPARLHGRRTGTGGSVELLLLSRLSPGVWRALVRPGRRMREGVAFEVPGDGTGPQLRGRVLGADSDGVRTLELSGEEPLHRLGVVPLPPYIREPLADTDRYQTVYADAEDSVAAPTAGLHFTRELLERVRALGAETVFVTLHVGWDSFRPVQTEDPASHKMHTEYWEISPRAADAINRAKREGRRVISVGTTAVRLLEQAAALHCEAALRGKAGPGIDRPSTSSARTEFARYVRGELVEPPGRRRPRAQHPLELETSSPTGPAGPTSSSCSASSSGSWTP